MKAVHYINRLTGKPEEENIYGESAIRLLYGNGFFQRTFGRALLHLFGKWPCISAIYGYLQKKASSKKKILPFIKEYKVDSSEFAVSHDQFQSFNDFFIRHLKPTARPIASGNHTAIIPADGRYLVYDKIETSALFAMKGRQYTIESFLQDPSAKRYLGGSLVMARLCPTDCHRFYFPVDGTPGESRLINGKLFSVNPIAIKNNPWIFFENKRYVTYIESPVFGTVAFVEIGATNVGSVIQTYTPGHSYKKGDEKGFFSFGGSALAIFFERGRIELAEDLLSCRKDGLERLCLIGQPLGHGGR